MGTAGTTDVPKPPVFPPTGGGTTGTFGYWVARNGSEGQVQNKWLEYERRKRQLKNWIDQGLDLNYEMELARIVEQLKI